MARPSKAQLQILQNIVAGARLEHRVGRNSRVRYWLQWQTSGAGPLIQAATIHAMVAAGWLDPGTPGARIEITADGREQILQEATP